MQFSKIAGSKFNFINGILAGISSFLCAFLIVGISANVVLRYFFNRPIWWMDEVAEFALLWLTFLAVAWVLRRGGHVRIDIIVNQLRPRVKDLTTGVLSIISALITLLIACYGAWVVWDYTQRGRYTYGVVEWPYGAVMSVIPFGFLLLFIGFLALSYRHLKRSKSLLDKKGSS